MITRTLDYFIKTFEFISPDISDEIVTEIKTCNWKEFLYSDINNLDISTTVGNVIDQPQSSYYTLQLDLNHQIAEYLNIHIDTAIKNYIDIFLHDMPWFFNWTDKSEICWIKYTTNSNMINHCDHVHNVFGKTINGVPILSIIGVLNDDYDGGELMFYDKKYELKKGKIIIFPSTFLYPHKVTKITKGERYSFVVWVW